LVNLIFISSFEFESFWCANHQGLLENPFGPPLAGPIDDKQLPSIGAGIYHANGVIPPRSIAYSTSPSSSSNSVLPQIDAD